VWVILSIALILFLGGLYTGPVLGAPEGRPVAEITFMMGAITLRNGQESEVVSIGRELQAGDRLRAGEESLCEISFKDGPIVRLDALSELLIAASGPSGEETVSGHLTAGKLWSNCSKFFGDPERFKTTTPTMVCGIRGTVWRLNVAADSSSTCRVYEGQVEVQPTWSPLGLETDRDRPGPPREVRGPQEVAPPREVSLEEWLVIVRRHQEVTVGRDRSIPEAHAFDTEADAALDWVRWNVARDRAMGR
jgi:hypothetical protein